MRVATSTKIPVEAIQMVDSTSANESLARRYHVSLPKSEQKINPSGQQELQLRYNKSTSSNSPSCTYDLSLEGLTYKVQKHIPGRSAIDFHIKRIDGRISISRNNTDQWEYFRMKRQMFRWELLRCYPRNEEEIEKASADDWEVMVEVLELGLFVWELMDGQDAALIQESLEKQEKLERESARASRKGGSVDFWDMGFVAPPIYKKGPTESLI